jgi:hypothetical protein
MKKIAISAVVILAFVISQSAKGFTTNKSKGDPQPAITKTYHVSHLPAWTSDGNFSDKMLLSYLQACATPKVWNANGGTASIKFYKQNLSIVVFGSAKTHRAIEKVLDQFPRTEEPAATGFQR